MVIRTWPGMDLTGNLFEEREREKGLLARQLSHRTRQNAVFVPLFHAARSYTVFVQKLTE